MRIQKAAATAVLSIAATGIAAANAHAATTDPNDAAADTVSASHIQHPAAPVPALQAFATTVHHAAAAAPAPRTAPTYRPATRAQREQSAHLEAAVVGGAIGGLVGGLMGVPLIHLGGPLVTAPVGALIGGAIGYAWPVTLDYN